MPSTNDSTRCCSLWRLFLWCRHSHLACWLGIAFVLLVVCYFFLFPQKRFCCRVFSFICIIACAYAYACLLFICVSTVIQKLEDGLWWSFWTVNEWRWLLIRDCIPYPGTIFCIESARWSCCELVFFTLAHFRLPCETSGIAWKKGWHFAAAFYCFLVKLIKYFYFISFVWLILYYHYWWNKDDQKVFLPGQWTLLKTVFEIYEIHRHWSLPVKILVLVCCWWRFGWSSAQLIVAVVSATSIILSSSKTG